MKTAPKKSKSHLSKELEATIEPPISVTTADFIKALTEWDRRYREEPERFVNEAHRLLKETAEDYGQAAGPYLMAILKGKI